MSHFTTPDFWDCCNALPKEVRTLADKNYDLLQANLNHPSLHFRRIKADVWSICVGIHCRALAFEESDGFSWFWIGPHTEYDKLIA